MLLQAQQEKQKQKEKDVFNALRKNEDISLLEEPATPMPWSLICKEEMKIIQKLNTTLTTKEFGRYSLKTWVTEFSDIFDKNFITDRIGKLSVIHTSTSKPIKEQLTAMEIAQEMRKDEYTWVHLLQNVMYVCWRTRQTTGKPPSETSTPG